MSEWSCCRFCGAPLERVVLDLGMSPLSNALRARDDSGDDARYPLRAMVCERCWLVQVPDVVPPQRIFDEYAYFSSYSTTWIEHGERFAESIARRLKLDRSSRVVEIASNDGCLLRCFQQRGIGVLGIEPAKNVAKAALDAGVPTISDYFGRSLAGRLANDGGRADLLVANNVLAHVPDLNDFVAGMARLLKPAGTATIEFPHLLRTVQRGEFDTFYHEHYSYFSLAVAERVLRKHGLRAVDVDELPTHGGSLRLYARLSDAPPSGKDDDGALRRLAGVRDAEKRANLESGDGYAALARSAQTVKRDLRSFLGASRAEGKLVAGYGAPAKATTLLNYCDVGADALPFTVDRSPHKQGRLIPGVRIPIEAPQRIFDRKPDYVLILPWNIKDEVREQMAGIGAWGGRFVVPIPSVAVLP